MMVCKDNYVKVWGIVGYRHIEDKGGRFGIYVGVDLP